MEIYSPCTRGTVKMTSKMIYSFKFDFCFANLSDILHLSNCEGNLKCSEKMNCDEGVNCSAPPGCVGIATDGWRYCYDDESTDPAIPDDHLNAKVGDGSW